MRHVALSLLVATAMMMSGCVEFFTPQADDLDDTQTDETGDDTSQSGDAGDSTSADDGTGSGSGSGSGSSGSSGGSGSTEPEPTENETEEPDEPEAAPPNEQLQDSPEDIDRPGEYAMLPKGNANSAVTTQVPTWSDDARWTHRTKTYAGTSCDQKTTVVGSDTFYEVPVFLVDQEVSNCGERGGQTADDQPRWKDHLMKINEDGCVDHELVFPLEDAKRWRYRPCSSNTTIDVTLDYKPNYLYNLKSVAAWHVMMTYASGSLTIEKWYGIEAQNYLREEVWVEIEGVPTRMVETDLLSYSH